MQHLRLLCKVDDPQKQLIEPAQLGTRNVLEQANSTDAVKRAVLTSSCAAIYTDFPSMAKPLIKRYGDAYPFPTND